MEWKEANDPERQALGLARHLEENGIGDYIVDVALVKVTMQYCNTVLLLYCSVTIQYCDTVLSYFIVILCFDTVLPVLSVLH